LKKANKKDDTLDADIDFLWERVCHWTCLRQNHISFLTQKLIHKFVSSSFTFFFNTNGERDG